MDLPRCKQSNTAALLPNRPKRRKDNELHKYKKPERTYSTAQTEHTQKNSYTSKILYQRHESHDTPKLHKIQYRQGYTRLMPWIEIVLPNSRTNSHRKRTSKVQEIERRYSSDDTTETA